MGQFQVEGNIGIIGGIINNTSTGIIINYSSGYLNTTNPYSKIENSGVIENIGSFSCYNNSTIINYSGGIIKNNKGIILNYIGSTFTNNINSIIYNYNNGIITNDSTLFTNTGIINSSIINNGCGTGTLNGTNPITANGIACP